MKDIPSRLNSNADCMMEMFNAGNYDFYNLNDVPKNRDTALAFIQGYNCAVDMLQSDLEYAKLIIGIPKTDN